MSFFVLERKWKSFSQTEHPVTNICEVELEGDWAKYLEILAEELIARVGTICAFNLLQ